MLADLLDGQRDKRKKERHDIVVSFFGARGGSRTRTPLRALAPEASESTNSTTRAWRLRRVVQRKQYTTTKLCECQHFFVKKSFSCKKNVSAEKRIKLGEHGDRLDRAGRGMIKLVKQ